MEGDFVGSVSFETEFVSCVVFMEIDGHAFGAERKAQQGIELHYSIHNGTRRILEAFSIVGFARKPRTRCCDVAKIIARFLSEGKVTFILRSGQKLFLSKALESSLVQLIHSIRAAHPQCTIVGDMSQLHPAAMPSEPLRGKNSRTIGARRRISVSPQRSCKRRTLEPPNWDIFGAALNRVKDLRGRAHVGTVPNGQPRPAPQDPILLSLSDDLLLYIIRTFGVVSECTGVCSRLAELIRRSRTRLRLRSRPKGTALEDVIFTPNHLQLFATDIPSKTVQSWVLSSPNLTILDLSSPVLAQGDVHDLFTHPRSPKSIQSLALRVSGRFTDVAARSLLHGLPDLRRLDLVGARSLTDEGLIPLYSGRRLNRTLEVLRIGAIRAPNAPHNSQPRYLSAFSGNKTLRLLVGSTKRSTDGNGNGFEDASTGPPPLLSFALTHCAGLTDLSSLQHLSSTLEELDIRGCSITDAAAAQAFAALPQLKYLNLSSEWEPVPLPQNT